jgi:hypothetical protein
MTIFVSFCPDKMMLNHLEYDDTFVVFANSHLRITYNSYSRYNFELKDGDGNIHYINSDIKKEYKTNICVTVDRETKKFKMYQDGILLDIKKYDIDFKFDNKTFYLGCDKDKNYFNGVINEFAIYDCILIAEEIENNLNYLVLDRKEPKVALLVHPYLEAHFKRGLISRQVKWFFKFKKWIPVRGVVANQLLEYHFVNEKNETIAL